MIDSTEKGRESKRANWVALALAAAVLVVVAAIVVGALADLGDAEMSAAGWGALVVGVVLTLALGFGLMGLVFISSRRGFDEGGDHRR